MRALLVLLLLVAVVGAPTVASFHGEVLPVRHVETRGSPGWTRIEVSDAHGNVTFEVEAVGGHPIVQRLEVHDAAGELALAFETVTVQGQNGVEIRASPLAPRVSLGGRYEGVATAYPGGPDCPGSTGMAFGGPVQSWSAFATFDAACLGPQPWTVTSFGLGPSVVERSLRLRSAAALTATLVGEGDGGVFVRMADATGSASAQVTLASLGRIAGAMHATSSVDLDDGFLGSFATFADTTAVATASNGAITMTCPCSFDGLPAGSWTFAMDGATSETQTVYLAGVHVSP